MIQPKDKRPMKKTMKRFMWFVVAYFIVGIFVATALAVWADIPQWANIIICVVLAGIMYLAFLGICARIDKKKKEKEESQPKKPDIYSE